MALKDARSNGLSWMEIAETLIKARDSGASGKSGQLLGDFMDEAAAQSGYAAILLRRMVPAFLFLRKMEEKYPEHDFRSGISERSGAVEKMEIIQRIERTDSQQALNLLLNIKEFSLSKLTAIYRSATPTIPRSRESQSRARPFSDAFASFGTDWISKYYRHPFYAECFTALEENISVLCGESDLRFARIRRYDYITPFAMAISLKERGISYIDSILPVLLTGNPTWTALHQVLKEATYSAQFFRHLWIITPPQDEPNHELIAALDDLGLTSVGYAQLVDGSFKIIISPTSEQEGPLTRRMMEEVLEKAVSTI
ncbi:MAG: hypothetical protein AB7G62_12650 [Magnetospirillum sp.]